MIKDKRWRSAIYTLAKLHRVDYLEVGLETFGKPLGYYNRQLKTFSAITNQQSAVIDAETKEPVGAIPYVKEMISMLRSSQIPDRTSLMHGDFKLFSHGRSASRLSDLGGCHFGGEAVVRRGEAGFGRLQYEFWHGLGCFSGGISNGKSIQSLLSGMILS
jgi:hypothetical protein